jgi:hypothetical protein
MQSKVYTIPGGVEMVIIKGYRLENQGGFFFRSNKRMQHMPGMQSFVNAAWQEKTGITRR